VSSWEPTFEEEIPEVATGLQGGAIILKSGRLTSKFLDRLRKSGWTKEEGNRGRKVYLICTQNEMSKERNRDRGLELPRRTPTGNLNLGVDPSPSPLGGS